MAKIKQDFGLSPVVMVGDGATDSEACPPADAFVGFGGVVCRDKVRQLTPLYVTHFAELQRLLA